MKPSIEHNDVVIVSAARTAIGRLNGSLSTIQAHELGAAVIEAVIKRAQIPITSIDELIMGQVLTAGCGQNPARQAAVKAKLPYHMPSYTVNKVCGSGLKTIALAADSIKNNDNKIMIAGGQENMSAAPHLITSLRLGKRYGPATIIDSIQHDGLEDAFYQYAMGVTAENIAKQYEISRYDQDLFAAHSHHKAEKAQTGAIFNDEICEVHLPQMNAGKNKHKADHSNIIDNTFSRDEFIRYGVNQESLSLLLPVFDKNGAVTAGNSSGINDGAAAVMLMSYSTALTHHIAPLVRIAATASVGVDPAFMGLGPVPAIEKCLQNADWRLDEVDLFEINEAFAAQAIAVKNLLLIDDEKLNVNGGAIALGHPIGASGCRIVVSLIYELKRRNLRRGVASLCIGGGMGLAIAIENIR